MPKTAGGLQYATYDLRAPWEDATLPVVLHHGIGTNRKIWAEWIPILAARYPVICFDMRGFGVSVVPSKEHVWSMQQMVADLWEVVDQCNSSKVHLVGESIGGTIVLAAAIARPDRVASISISNATFRGNGIGELPSWEAQFAEGVATWSNRMMENRFFPGVLSPAARVWFEQEQQKTLPHVAIGLGKVLANTDLAAGLAALDVPVAVTLPDSSPFVPVEHGVQMMRLIKDAQLRVVPGVRHGLPFSHAKQESFCLLEQLNRLTSPYKQSRL